MTLNTGLEALYHFTGNANDSSGNGNNLISAGTPTFIPDKNAVPTQAVDLDSGDNYRSDSYSGTTGDLSYSWWTNWKSANVASGAGFWLFATGLQSDANKYPLAILSGGTNSLQLYQNDGAVSIGTARTVNNDGNWHHYVAVRKNGGATMELWEDGKLLGSDSVTARTPATPDRLRFNSNLSGTFGLDVTHTHDEIRVYHRALSEYEIQQLYFGYDSSNDEIGILNEGLEALYHFTGNANDSSGNGRNGTVDTGITYVNDKNSVALQAVDFNMTTTGNIILNSIPSLSGDKSFSMWVNIDNVTGSDYLMDSNDGSRFIFALNPSSTGNFEHYDGVGGWKDTGQPYTLGTWTHIAWVFRNGGTTLDFYYNGSFVTSISVANRTLESTPVLGNQWDLGGSFFDGKMDEVRIYSRALSEDEVLMLAAGYDTNADTVETKVYKNEAYYNLDNDYLDVTGNGNNATNVGTTLVTGKINNAASFNGTNNWIDVPNTLVPSTGSFSVGCWVNHNNTIFSHVFSIGDGTPYFRLLSLNPGTSYVLEAFNGSLNPLIFFSVPANTWTHIVCVFDRENNLIEVYKDGVSQGTSNAAGFGSLAGTNFRIGQRNSGSYFNGIQDEISVWSRALTPTEVSQLYNSGDGIQYPYTTPEAGPKGNSLGFKLLI